MVIEYAKDDLQIDIDWMTNNTPSVSEARNFILYLLNCKPCKELKQ